MQKRAPFSNLSEIDPGRPETWEGRVFLTLDVDWAHDDVIAEVLDLLEPAQVRATWFITHDSPILERLRSNPLFELGIHPNFNFLLEGDPRNGRTASEVVDRLLAIVPEAKSVRSHAMTQSTGLMHLFASKGLTHEANHFIPEQLETPLKPWHWLSMIKVPYFWEDDVYCLSAANSVFGSLVHRPGLRVFDFHPIHVFLNTDDLARYEKARPYFGNPTALRSLRNPAEQGSRALLTQLLEPGV
jgi:hypothetical protein